MTTIHAGDSTTGCADCSLNDLAVAIEESGRDFGAMKAYAEYNYGKDIANWEDWVDEFDESYFGSFWSEREFAEELAEQLDMLSEMPENLRYYFDFDLFARDLLMGDYWATDTYYFRSI